MLQPLCQFLALFPTEKPHTLHLLQVVTVPPAFGRFRSGASVTDLLTQEECHKAERYLQKVAEQITALIPPKTSVAVTTETIVDTDVAGTVLKQAQTMSQQTAIASYDLIALATHGRSGIKRAVLGSVTEHVLPGATTLPLFVVCPLATEAEKKNTSQGERRAPETTFSQGPVGLL